MYDYLYCENGGLEWLPDNVGFVPSLNIYAENSPCYVSETLATCVGLCSHTHALGLRMQDLVCIHRPRISLAFYFQKIDFLHVKSIFNFNTSQVNL